MILEWPGLQKEMFPLIQRKEGPRWSRFLEGHEPGENETDRRMSRRGYRGEGNPTGRGSTRSGRRRRSSSRRDVEKGWSESRAGNANPPRTKVLVFGGLVIVAMTLILFWVPSIWEHDPKVEGETGLTGGIEQLAIDPVFDQASGAAAEAVRFFCPAVMTSG